MKAEQARIYDLLGCALLRTVVPQINNPPPVPVLPSTASEIYEILERQMIQA